MNNAIVSIRIRGLSNAIKIVDLLIKNVVVDVHSIIPDRAGGNLNIILKGNLGQIEAGVDFLNDFLNGVGLKVETLIIPNFDIKILSDK